MMSVPRFMSMHRVISLSKALTALQFNYHVPSITLQILTSLTVSVAICHITQIHKFEYTVIGVQHVTLCWITSMTAWNASQIWIYFSGGTTNHFAQLHKFDNISLKSQVTHCTGSQVCQYLFEVTSHITKLHNSDNIFLEKKVTLHSFTSLTVSFWSHKSHCTASQFFSVVET